MSDTRITRPMPAEIVIDDQLSMRCMTLADADAMFRIIQDDPEIGHNVTWPVGIHSLGDTRKAIEQLLLEDKSPYVLQENGEAIGFIGTWYPESTQNEVGFSYFLSKGKRGHGFITRAVKTLMGTTLDNMPVDKFLVNIIDGNEPSIAIANKLGFQPTDELTYDAALQAYIRRYERSADE